jgi:hypothetical protein
VTAEGPKKAVSAVVVSGEIFASCFGDDGSLSVELERELKNKARFSLRVCKKLMRVTAPATNQALATHTQSKGAAKAQAAPWCDGSQQ